MFFKVLLPVIVAAVVLLVFAVSLFIRSKKVKYDERQVFARNAACKRSFFFLMVYCFICGFLYIFEVKWAGAAVQMFLGIILSIALFLAITIIKDAYFTNSQKQTTQSVISFFSYGMTCLLFFLMGLKNGDALWQNGELSTLVLYLTASACSLVLGIISVIKLHSENAERRRK